MKRASWKTALWLCLIPTAASLLLTVAECILTNQFYSWFWIPEWLCEVTALLARYIAEFAMFVCIGIAACIVFYQKWQKAIYFSLLPIAFTVLPLLWYLLRHLFFMGTATVDEMMLYFVDDTSVALYFLIYGVAAVLILWAVKGFYAFILKETPEKGGSAFSPRRPVGLSALIFFGGLTAISAVYFTVVGEYGVGNFLSLGLEVLINTAGYFSVCLGAFAFLHGAHDEK